MTEAGFGGIGKYITGRQNTVAQYIVIQTILDLCERSAWRPGSRVSRRWWELVGLDLEGANKRAAAAAADSDREESIGVESHDGSPVGSQ